YQNNWTETDSSNVTITQWGLSGDSLFKCISISQKNMENQVVNEGKPVISPPAVLDISHLEMNTKKGSKSHGLLLRIIILLSAVAGVILFIAVKKKRVINNHSTYDISNSVQDETEKDEKEVMDTVIPESIETPEDVPEESDLQESQPTESTDQNPLSLSETALSSMEDAYAKIKEIVYNDAVRHFKPVSLLELPSEEDYKVQLLRKKLYREIHGEILQWVVFESNRLTKSLEALTLKVDTLAHLQEPELNLIKDEINKISRNVENFKKLGLGRNKEFFPEA
ncbi:MAG: hypothetical protein GX640_20195, partial [Fibrobacter sp.]|nr:hypothetical protein [Fibrobacter sp.]